MDQRVEQSLEPAASIGINISIANKEEEKQDLKLNLKENFQEENNHLSATVNIQQKQPTSAIRSESSQQFDNSKILGFQSGRILFNQSGTKTSSNQNLAKKQKIDSSEIKEGGNFSAIQQNLSVKLSPKMIHQVIDGLIVKEKKPKKIMVNDGFEGNKRLKLIYTHFCKQNYISSIKSTLFEEKPKIMEEMSLNRWMVFCKEFDIFINLCKLKIQLRKKNTQQIAETLSNSQLKQGTKVKQIKQVERLLIQIFKKATQHHTRMEYIQFIQAMKLVSEQFKPEDIDETLNFEREFLNKYLFCSSQKQCLNKLANLKFTFNIPQIEYGKPTIFPQSPKNLSKSRAQMSAHKQKQNITHQPKKLKKTTTMSINPILKDAKNTISLESNSKSTLNLTKKVPLKLKPTSDQPKMVNHQMKKKVKQGNKLFEYFDTSSDEILQAYFKVEQTVHID